MAYNLGMIAVRRNAASVTISEITNIRLSMLELPNFSQSVGLWKFHSKQSSFTNDYSLIQCSKTLPRKLYAELKITEKQAFQCNVKIRNCLNLRIWASLLLMILPSNESRTSCSLLCKFAKSITVQIIKSKYEKRFNLISKTWTFCPKW